MGGFTAKLELPGFIPKERILGKYVFDSDVACIGLVEDWTYSSDGEIKMVVKIENAASNSSMVLVPFSYIDRVGQFILLRMNKEKFLENMNQETERILKKEEEIVAQSAALKPPEITGAPKEVMTKGKGEKEAKSEKNKEAELKYFDEIDKKKLNQFIKK